MLLSNFRTRFDEHLLVVLRVYSDAKAHIAPNYVSFTSIMDACATWQICEPVREIQDFIRRRPGNALLQIGYNSCSEDHSASCFGCQLL